MKKERHNIIFDLSDSRAIDPETAWPENKTCPRSPVMIMLPAATPH